LTKYTYQLLPLDQHHKNWGKNQKNKNKNALRTGGCLTLTFFFKLVFFFHKPKLAGSLILKL
jgi:hypothetical protein